MEKILRSMRQKKKTFEKLLGKAETELRKAPEGSLKIRDYKGRVEYYRRKPGTDSKAVYIPVSDKEQPRDLVKPVTPTKQQLIQKWLEAPYTTLDGITIYPDFTIYDVYRNRVLYLEHCGMLGKDDYADDFVRKWNLYAANRIIAGDRLILTYESNDRPLNTLTMRTILAYHLPKYYENEPAA